MLKIVKEVGRDEGRHLLVEVECSYCGKQKVMRKGNMKRAKSCGCVRKQRYKEMVEQWKKKPMKLLPESAWSEYDETKLGPDQIVKAVMAKGLYVPAVKGKKVRNVAAEMANGVGTNANMSFAFQREKG